MHKCDVEPTSAIRERSNEIVTGLGDELRRRSRLAFDDGLTRDDDVSGRVTPVMPARLLDVPSTNPAAGDSLDEKPDGIPGGRPTPFESNRDHLAVRMAQPIFKKFLCFALICQMKAPLIRQRPQEDVSLADGRSTFRFGRTGIDMPLPLGCCRTPHDWRSTTAWWAARAGPAGVGPLTVAVQQTTGLSAQVVIDQSLERATSHGRFLQRVGPRLGLRARLAHDVGANRWTERDGRLRPGIRIGDTSCRPRARAAHGGSLHADRCVRATGQTGRAWPGSCSPCQAGVRDTDRRGVATPGTGGGATRNPAPHTRRHKRCTSGWSFAPFIDADKSAVVKPPRYEVPFSPAPLGRVKGFGSMFQA